MVIVPLINFLLLAISHVQLLNCLFALRLVYLGDLFHFLRFQFKFVLNKCALDRHKKFIVNFILQMTCTWEIIA
jgi:hypothetical protein